MFAPAWCHLNLAKIFHFSMATHAGLGHMMSSCQTNKDRKWADFSSDVGK